MPDGLADGVGQMIERLIDAAAQNKGPISPALITEMILEHYQGAAEFKDSKLSRVQLAEAILRAAASRGLEIQLGYRA